MQRTTNNALYPTPASYVYGGTAITPELSSLLLKQKPLFWPHPPAVAGSLCSGPFPFRSLVTVSQPRPFTAGCGDYSAIDSSGIYRLSRLW